MTGQELIDWIKENQAEGVDFFTFYVDEDGDTIYEDIDPFFDFENDIVRL